MTRLEDDLNYLQGASASLETYLLSNELFWPLGGGFSRGMVSSRLSLGALLLTMARLQASANPTSNLTQMLQRIEATRKQWRVHWEKKAVREFTSRLNLWQNALADLGSGSNNEQAVYSVEVRNRVMVELLQVEAGQIPDHELSRIQGLDSKLKSSFIPGEFIWEPDLQSAFPPTIFWYLYGKIRP